MIEEVIVIADKKGRLSIPGVKPGSVYRLTSPAQHVRWTLSLEGLEVALGSPRMFDELFRHGGYFAPKRVEEIELP